MTSTSKQAHTQDVAGLYDALAANGPYGTLAPQNAGGRKSRYVAAVFDAALLPELAGQRSGDLLDLGCGTGIFSIQALRHAQRVFGMDVSLGVLKVARDLANGDQRLCFVLGDGACLPFADSTFDWVVARESLCYVPDQALPGVLAEIHRVLRPAGRFLWLEQMSDDPDFQVHPGAPLLKKRSPRSLLELASSANFNLLRKAVVRRPRFPLIYPVWAGLVPLQWLSALARTEVRWHGRHQRLAGRRWFDGLLVLQKPE